MTRPRIGFDVAPLAGNASRGLQRVVGETLRALESDARQGGAFEIVRLAPSAGSHGARSHARWRTELARLARSERLAGLHSFTSAFAWRARVPRVQTIHELPWRRGESENADLAHRVWAACGPLFAARVATATQHTARDLTSGARLGKRRVRVIPWGVGAPFAPEPPPGGVDEPVLRRYRLGEDPIVLCLGGARAKKNTSALLRGLHARSSARRRRLQVVVTGADTSELRALLGQASQLGLASAVQWIEQIDELDLAPLLRLSSVVPLLSRSEGFGLPVLEALACGTPVLVPHDSAQAEVAGDAGIACDPRDPNAVAAALERALDEREALRYALPARAAQFPWSRTARAIAELWSEILGVSSSRVDSRARSDGAASAAAHTSSGSAPCATTDAAPAARSRA